MKNEQNEKKSRKPLLRIGLTALISAAAAFAVYLITGRITLLRDCMALSLGADVFASLYEGARGVVKAINNKNAKQTTNARTRNRVRNRELSETMADIPTEENIMGYGDIVPNTPTTNNSRKQGR